MAKWLVVLSFSAALLSLAVALPVFGRMVGGRQVVRLATICGAAASLCSVANIFEDGFQIEWFFFVFVLGLLILDVALLALTIVIARTAPDRYRLLAGIPAGTLAGILIFPVAGGPIMLITWLVAAIAALKMSSGRTPLPVEPAVR
jgi:MFS family permease